MKTLTIITQNRVNAAGGRIRTMRVVDLEWLRNYSSSTKGAKTIKSAINKLNKSANDRYANCIRQYCCYDIIGKIKTDLEPGTEVTTFDTDFDTLVKKFETEYNVKIAV